jgi:hypothetical protein
MPEQVLQSRVVRRRNPRPINSCVECRTRKSRCSKTHPCQNCTAFGRECVFITVPESATRRRQRDSNSKSNADWTQPIPLRTQSQTSPGKFENTNTSPNVPTTTPGTPPRDYEWEAYQQDVEVDPGDAWERLPAEPEETPDDVYEDENDDEDQIATDLTIRIGRMIICENITGFFRPQYAEEVLSSLPSSTVLHRIDSLSSIQLLRRIVLAWQASLGAYFVYLISRWSKSTAIVCSLVCGAYAISLAIPQPTPRGLSSSASRY